MTLSDMLHRDVGVEWHEAVALIRDVIDRAQDQEESLPDLHQVNLLRSGQVEFLGRAPTADRVGRIGQMLQALLVRADPPVQLRLLLVQRHGSLSEYSSALAFFERPDRTGILQALYGRATAAVPLNEPAAHIEQPNSRPEDLEPQDVHELRAKRRFGVPVYAAGVLALVVVLWAGVVVARRGEVASQESSKAPATISQKLGAAVESAVSAVGSAVGLKAPDVPPAAPTADVPVSPRVSPRAPRAKSQPSGGSGPGIQRAALSAFDIALPPAAPAVPLESVTIAASAEEPQVYSAGSAGVSPPIGIRPQLPNHLPDGVRSEDLTQIELVILSDGTVDSVKLVGQPKTVHAFMLLSAAKAWQFHPAIKDGVPVKYRKTLWVAH